MLYFGRSVACGICPLIIKYNLFTEDPSRRLAIFSLRPASLVEGGIPWLVYTDYWYQRLAHKRLLTCSDPVVAVSSTSWKRSSHRPRVSLHFLSSWPTFSRWKCFNGCFDGLYLCNPFPPILQTSPPRNHKTNQRQHQHPTKEANKPRSTNRRQQFSTDGYTYQCPVPQN